MTDKVQPWSESRTEEPVHLPDELETKNARLLNPLAAPALYGELYDGKADQVTIKDPDTGQKENYELVANINNEETSSHFKVIRNPETHHYILIGKGMDLPGRDEGAGRLGFAEDLGQHSDAEDGKITGQVLDGEKAYLDLLQNPEVKSLEVIGYSIGSIPANYLASVYGAKVTNIADLGVPDAGAQIKGNFNTSAEGLFPGAYGQFAENLNNNIVGLDLRADLLGGTLGDVGQEYGQRIILDEESMALSGVAHVPQVYAAAVEEYTQNAPDVDVTHSQDGTQFTPFTKLGQ